MKNKRAGTKKRGRFVIPANPPKSKPVLKTVVVRISTKSVTKNTSGVNIFYILGKQVSLQEFYASYGVPARVLDRMM